MAEATRRPAVSGRFYVGASDELSVAVDEMLGAVEAAPRPACAGMAPHAGHVYSGLTAAHLFADVALPSILVILAPNHTGRCSAPGGASIWASGAFQTPLGNVAIARPFADALMAECDLVSHDPQAHLHEHAIEVLLPFVQRVRADAAIVPIVLAWDDWSTCRQLADALARVVRASSEDAFVLASSDLNHYEPASVSETKDRAALECVEAMDGERLLATCHRRGISMCGRAPAAVTLEAARQLGATSARILDYRHSGWQTGDDTAVVGYAAAVIR